MFFFGSSKVKIRAWNNPVQVWKVLFGTSMLESSKSSTILNTEFCLRNWPKYFFICTVPSGHVVYVASPQAFACWVCECDPRRWHDGWSVCCGCCVLSGSGPCFGLFPLPKEAYLVCCVWMWSWRLLMRRPWLIRGCCSVKKKTWFVSKCFLLF